MNKELVNELESIKKSLVSKYPSMCLEAGVITYINSLISKYHAYDFSKDLKDKNKVKFETKEDFKGNNINHKEKPFEFNVDTIIKPKKKKYRNKKKDYGKITSEDCVEFDLNEIINDTLSTEQIQKAQELLGSIAEKCDEEFVSYCALDEDSDFNTQVKVFSLKSYEELEQTLNKVLKDIPIIKIKGIEFNTDIKPTRITVMVFYS